MNLLVKFILEGYVELTKTTIYSNDQTNLYFISHKGRLDLFQILLLLSTINWVVIMWQALCNIHNIHMPTYTSYKMKNFSLYHVVWAILLTDKVRLVADRKVETKISYLHHLNFNKIFIIMFQLNSILIEYLLFARHCFVEKSKHTRLISDVKEIT